MSYRSGSAESRLEALNVKSEKDGAMLRSTTVNVKTEALLKALAQQAERSVDRTIKILDDTIAYVDGVLSSMRRVR